MAHLSSLLEGEALPDAVSPLDFADRDILLFTHTQLSAVSFCCLVPSWRKATLVLPRPMPQPGLAELRYGTFRASRFGAEVSPEVVTALREGADAAVFLFPPRWAGAPLLERLLRGGVKDFYFLWEGGWSLQRRGGFPRLRLAAWLLRMLPQPLVEIQRLPGPQPPPAASRGTGPATVVPKVYEELLSAPPPPQAPGGAAGAETGEKPALQAPAETAAGWKPALQGAPQRVIQYIHALYPGGAERQLCFLAAGLRERGWDSSVLLGNPLEGEQAHYAPMLQRAGVPFVQAGRQSDPALLRRFREQKLDPYLVSHLPDFLRVETQALLEDLLLAPPVILHGWLDASNLTAGLAGLLAGVPCLVLSTRNVNPSNFPRFYHPWMKDWYQFLSRSHRVHFIANSRNGGRDYAQWLGLPVERFHVILNGVDFREIPQPTPEEKAALRRSLDLGPDTPLLAGVFRLDPEKRPELFVTLVARIAQAVPGLHAVLAGIGGLQEETLRAVREAGLDGRVHLVGRRKDVNVIMAASDVMLLASEVEGTPNVLLESQWLGCPVVATRAGGVEDIVADGRTGFTHAVDDLDGLVASATRVLRDPELRARLSQEGPRFMQERFSVARMVDETVALYRKGLRD